MSARKRHPRYVFWPRNVPPNRDISIRVQRRACRFPGKRVGIFEHAYFAEALCSPCAKLARS